MNSEKIIREQLLSLLRGGNAHMTLEEAVENFPQNRFNDIFPNGEYSPGIFWNTSDEPKMTSWNSLSTQIIKIKNGPKITGRKEAKKPRQKIGRKPSVKFKKIAKLWKKLSPTPKPICTLKSPGVTAKIFFGKFSRLPTIALTTLASLPSCARP